MEENLRSPENSLTEVLLYYPVPITFIFLSNKVCSFKIFTNSMIALAYVQNVSYINIKLLQICVGERKLSTDFKILILFTVMTSFSINELILSANDKHFSNCYKNYYLNLYLIRVLFFYFSFVIHNLYVYYSYFSLNCMTGDIS